MALLPDAGVETIEDKLRRVLKLRSATVNDIPVLMHMARALAEQQGLAPLMTATAAGWRRDLGQAFDATVAAIKNSPSTWRSPFACRCREQQHGRPSSLVCTWLRRSAAVASALRWCDTC